MGTTGRRSGLAAAAAVVALLASGCGEAGPPDQAAPDAPASTPASIDDLPEGPSSDYPFLADGVLRVGAASITIDADRLVFRGGTTLVGRADDRNSRWWLLVDGSLEPLLDDATPYLVPVLSADGGTAAWRVEVTSRAVDELTRHHDWDVVVFDVPSRTVLGVTRLQGDVTCCDQGGMLMVTGVTNDGRVSLSGGPAGNLSIWRAGDPLVTVRVRATAYPGVDAWPLGVSYVLEGDAAGKVRYGRVDATEPSPRSAACGRRACGLPTAGGSSTESSAPPSRPVASW